MRNLAIILIIISCLIGIIILTKHPAVESKLSTDSLNNREISSTKKQEKPVKTNVSDKNALLIQAVKNGNLQAVQTLLAEGATPNTKDEGEVSVLVWAISHEHSSGRKEIKL